MAMTGMRHVTTQLGLVEQVPPEAILEQKAPSVLRSIPEGLRPVFVELAHWGYGGLGGAAFGMLPEALRRHRWSGPGYGIAVWMLFELALAPALGLQQARQKRVVERIMFAGDHALYGVIAAGIRSPERPE
jgi:hypothetical protein